MLSSAVATMAGPCRGLEEFVRLLFSSDVTLIINNTLVVEECMVTKLSQFQDTGEYMSETRCMVDE